MRRIYELILAWLNSRVQIESERKLRREIEELKAQLAVTTENLRIRESENRIQSEEVALLSAVNARNINRVRAETAKTGVLESRPEDAIDS